jgi:hypothetical protein
VEPLLGGLRVLELGGEPTAIGGRALADLGAEVVLVEPRGGHALRDERYRWQSWAAGKRSVTIDGADDPLLDALLRDADVVIDTPGHPGTLTLDPARAPDAVWVSITPFGLEPARRGRGRPGSCRGQPKPGSAVRGQRRPAAEGPAVHPAGARDDPCRS